MQIIIACAKDMTDKATRKMTISPLPLFQKEAEHIAMEMMAYSTDELQHILKCNPRLAATNRLRYSTFFDPQPKSAAALAYTGMAYRHLRAVDFSEEDSLYAQRHLWITSFLYGLLRPMDNIRTYRLEGNVVLADEGINVFHYWRNKLTRTLIESVKADGGTLVYLASEEMKGLFDWHEVEAQVNVVYPEFLVHKQGEMKTIVVYAKMCRGAMSNFIIRNRIESVAELTAFEYEGFTYNNSLSDGNKLVFSIE